MVDEIVMLVGVWVGVIVWVGVRVGVIVWVGVRVGVIVWCRYRGRCNSKGRIVNER
jgi:hypothetical protein